MLCDSSPLFRIVDRYLVVDCVVLGHVVNPSPSPISCNKVNHSMILIHLHLVCIYAESITLSIGH
jgi:hypothetical protein